MKRSAFVPHLIALSLSVCLAQAPGGHISIEHKPGSVPAIQARFDKILTRLDVAMLNPAVSGSWEAQVAAASAKSVQEILRLEFDDSDGPMLFTFSSDDGDTLVARWRGRYQERAESAIWLWDTPFHTAVIMELGSEMLRPDALARYCEGVLNWRKGRLQLRSLKLVYLNPEVRKEEAWGYGEQETTAIGSFGFTLYARSGANRAWVAFLVTKPVVGGLPDACGVRERFPPLATRLATISRPNLFAELGKEYDGQSLLTYPERRDTIIIKELLSRGPLSAAELRQVAVGDFRTDDRGTAYVVNARMHALVAALRERDAFAAYAPLIEAVLLDLPVTRATENMVIGPMFSAMQRAKVDVSHLAFASLERGRFVDLSLSYLGSHIRDQQQLHRLEGMWVGPDREEFKKSILAKIRFELAKEGDPVRNRR